MNDVMRIIENLLIVIIRENDESMEIGLNRINCNVSMMLWNVWDWFGIRYCEINWFIWVMFVECWKIKI
jgi:hypothetical protein